MKNLIGIVVITLLVTGAYFISSKNEPTPESPGDTDAKVSTLLKRNLTALEEEDIDLFMEGLHPQSEAYENSKESALNLLELYDVDMNLDSYNILTESDEEIVVAYTQTTKRIGGNDDFKDNKITGRHTLRKDSGVWKIYSTTVLDVVYLD